MKTLSLAVVAREALRSPFCSWVSRGVAVMVALSWMNLSPSLWAQIVQIPSMGTFNISTSMAVPDRGTGFMGGNASGIGSTARGAIGRSSGISGASVSTTVIDLDELDKMIRSQASSASTEPTLKQFDPSGYSRLPAKPKGRATPAGYDYLAALSGDSPEMPHVSGYGSVLHETDSDATKYYLNLANLARQRGHWASVETYYRLAWQSLPQSRRETALRSLEKSRARASQERVMLKGQVPSKRGSNSR
jgi:hypothetical protein